VRAARVGVTHGERTMTSPEEEPTAPPASEGADPLAAPAAPLDGSVEAPADAVGAAPSSDASTAEARCAIHAAQASTGTCPRCRNFVCGICGSPCPACRARVKKTRIEAWQGSLGLVVGGVGAQIAGAFVFVVGVVILIAQRGPDADFSNLGPELIGSIWVIGPSILLTGLTMVGVAVVIPLLAKVRPSDALGLRGAPWPAFLAAPIGILALGPTSDAMRQLMVAIAPNLTFGNLDALDLVARSAPLYIIVPVMALIPGIAEETLFRGMFQRSIRNPRLALVLSAVLFAAYHMDPHHVFAVLPLGFFLAWLAHRTQSLWVPITAHVANNSAAVIGSRFIDPSEPQPTILDEWWWLPIGWAVAALCVGVIVWSTRDRAERSPEANASLAVVVVPRS
jgi:membrane protease YdiL (CAAX protease family)